MTNRYALIVAGGTGTRMKSKTPKQFINLKGVPILLHTINAFSSLSNPPDIYLVLPADEHKRWTKICEKHNYTHPHTLISGGKTRFDSVKNGLDAISGEGLVAIHDGVRPLISKVLIENCYNVAQKFGNAVPATQPYETVRFGTASQNRMENRSLLWLIQTPQVFYLKDIKQCYKNQWNPDFTDDASVADSCGVKINLIQGERENLKITTPLDIAIAKSIWHQ